jgi:hypothetical protein
MAYIKTKPACAVLWGNLRDIDYLEDIRIDGRIILK